jgi:hypothetical protein
LFLVEAGTDHRRQFFDGGLNAGEAAFCPIYRADDRMDVGVDESGQYQLALASTLLALISILTGR